nr:efflux RND transporter periplasmic adaptor subunit [uncultured Dethiosulfovibrio sp.]
MNRLKMAYAAVIIAMWPFCAPALAQDPAPPARVEVIEIVTEPQVYKGFSENSTLEAIDQVTIYPRVSGRLMKMLVKQGDPVKSGQPLAELDHREMDAQISQAQAQIAVAQAQVAQAMAELENAQRERDRYKRLVTEGFSTQQQLDSKETVYRTAKAAVDLNRAQVRQYQANLKRLQVDLSEYTLKASIPGTVVNDYNRTPGEMITTQTALVQIADTTRLKAVVQATEAHAKLIENGMAAIVTVGNTRLNGQVYRVRPFVDVSTRTTQVEVAMDNSVDLKPGMFARVFIVEKELKDAIMVPSESIRTLEDSSWVMVSKEGKAHKVEVVTGITADGRIEVIQGISPGDKVIVSGGRNLEDQDPVTEIAR